MKPADSRAPALQLSGLDFPTVTLPPSAGPLSRKRSGSPSGLFPAHVLSLSLPWDLASRVHLPRALSEVLTTAVAQGTRGGLRFAEAVVEGAPQESSQRVCDQRRV